MLAELNPRLVTLAISGFGHDGPEGGRAGYDQIAQGEGGLMSLTGPGPDDPQQVGVPIGDLLAGMYGAYGVLAALLERERTGRGQVVRTSLLAAIVGVHAFQGTAWTVAGQVGRAQGNHHPSIAPYGLFHCADGSVQLSCGSEGLWRRLCAEFGLDPEAPGMATNGERVDHRAEVIALLEGAFADIPAEDLLARLDQGRHPGRQGAHASTRSTAGTRRVAGPARRRRARHRSGRLTLPGPPLRFFAPGPGRRDRDHPPRPHRSPGARCRRRRDPRLAVRRRRRPAADGDDVEDGHAT